MKDDLSIEVITLAADKGAKKSVYVCSGKGEEKFPPLLLLLLIYEFEK